MDKINRQATNDGNAVRLVAHRFQHLKEFLWINFYVFYYVFYYVFKKLIFFFLVYTIVGLMGECGCHGGNLSRSLGRLLILSRGNTMNYYPIIAATPGVTIGSATPGCVVSGVWRRGPGVSGPGVFHALSLVVGVCLGRAHGQAGPAPARSGFDPEMRIYCFLTELVSLLAGAGLREA